MVRAALVLEYKKCLPLLCGETNKRVMVTIDLLGDSYTFELKY